MRVVPAIVACILLSLVFAGCTSTGPEGSAKAGRARGAAGAIQAPPAGSFIATGLDGALVDPNTLLGLPPLSGESRYIGKSSFEPTLGIGKDGAIFMSAADFKGIQGPEAFVYASYDEGATWKNVTPKLPVTNWNNPPTTADPFVTTDPITGRVFSIDLQQLACATIIYSDDSGKTWTLSPAACGLPPGVHDHQSLASGKPRLTPVMPAYPDVLYYCINRIGDTSCAESYNGGLSFGPLEPVMLGVDVEAGGFCGGLAAHVKTDNAGRAFLGKGQCGVPSVGVTEDEGKTWNVYVISKSAGVMGHDVSLAVDKADNVYAGWTGQNGLYYFSYSRDHGKTWSPARIVSPPSVTATDKPAIAAGAEGQVAFAYIGTTHPKGYANKAAADWVGATWNGYISEITNVFAENPVTLTTTANPIDDPIAINQCGNTRCGGLYDFIDVDIDAKGRPWASMVDVCFEKCRADFKADPKSAKAEQPIGFVGTLATGPALTQAGGLLPALTPMAPASAVAAPK